MVAAWRCLAKARGEGCDWVVGKGWGVDGRGSSTTYVFAHALRARVIAASNVRLGAFSRKS